MKLLVELLSLDPQLNAAKFSSIFTHKMAKDCWQNIASQRNALPGAEKHWEKWKKQDTKVTTKTKAAAIKRHQKSTGGGPPCDVIMSDVQNDVLPLLSQVSVGGHSNSTESVVKFTFDDVPTKKTGQSLSREMVENTGMECSSSAENKEVFIVDNVDDDNIFEPLAYECEIDKQQTV
ncbi:hypothetical protein ACI65C_000108 [Semiaphis heraclei]